MMKRMWASARAGLVLLLFSFLAMGLEARASSAVALIPGTWNSIAPGALRWSELKEQLELTPYYSRDVLESFESRDHFTHVVKRLSWFGQLEKNGEWAQEEIREWYLSSFPRRDTPLVLVGHSAGGLYALYAASKLWDLPISKIILIATPLEGLELAEQIANSGVMGETLKRMTELSDGWFDFRGLPGMLPESVDRFLNEFSIDPKIQIIATTGTQDAPFFPWQITKSEMLSPLMAMSGFFIRGRSDGIVSRRSSYGLNSKLGTRIQSWTDIEMVLDHPEQVLDYRIFKLLGSSHSIWIREEQRRFYGAIADELQ